MEEVLSLTFVWMYHMKAPIVIGESKKSQNKKVNQKKQILIIFYNPPRSHAAPLCGEARAQVPVRAGEPAPAADVGAQRLHQESRNLRQLRLPRHGDARRLRRHGHGGQRRAHQVSRKIYKSAVLILCKS